MNNIKQWLEDYDSGKEVESIRMGGGVIVYEKGLQILLVAMLRTIPEFSFESASGEVLDEISKGMFNIALGMKVEHNYTKSQVFSAASVACAFWKQSPEVIVAETRKVAPSRIVVIIKAEDESLLIKDENY